MLKVLAACAAGVVCLASCASTIALPTSSASGALDASSPAADVRARMTLLSGEQTYVLAKLTVAAAAGRKDEFASYAALLATNGAELAGVLSKAVGDTAGQRFAQSWTRGNSFFVDYLVAVTTHQHDLADAAMMNLNTQYVPQLAQDLSTPLNISTSSANRMLTDQVTTIKQFMDDAVAGTPSAFYPDVRAAYAKATAMGGAIAEATVWKFPDKYPGDATASGAKGRAQLDSLLQENAYLLSMTTDAAVTGATRDEGAAKSALQACVEDMSRVIGSLLGSQAGTKSTQAWGDEDNAFVAYASAADDAARARDLDGVNEGASSGLKFYLSGLHVKVDTISIAHQTIGLIDDQRAKSYGAIAAEDRQSAALLISIGDLMMGARG